MAAHAGLLAAYELDRRPWLTFVLLGWAFTSFFWAAWRWQDTAAAPLILGVSVLLRLLLLPLPPTLSDDALRYVWDGRVATAGFNPYRLAPESPELAGLRDARWERMPHKEVATVYPPLALGVFSIASWLPDPLVGVKILLCVAELLGCFLLVRLATALGHGPGRAVWYCWNPLAALEVAGMGHVDGLLVAAQVAAVLALVRRRPAAAGAAAGAAVAAKLVPLVVLPAWTRASHRPARFAAAALAVVLAAGLPVVAAVGGVPPGLVEYGVSWEFNGPLYEPLWRLYDQTGLDAAVKAGLDRLKLATDRHEFWNRFYPFVYPQLLAKVTLLGLFAVLFAAAWRDRDPVSASGRILGSVVICSATCYPWYLLWVLPWAALARHRAWLAAAALLQLAYLPQLAGVALFPWVWLAIWGPFFILMVRSSWSTG